MHKKSLGSALYPIMRMLDTVISAFKALRVPVTSVSKASFSAFVERVERPVLGAYTLTLCCGDFASVKTSITRCVPSVFAENK